MIGNKLIIWIAEVTVRLFVMILMGYIMIKLEAPLWVAFLTSLICGEYTVKNMD